MTRAADVLCASYSPDGRYIATGSASSTYYDIHKGDTALRLWDGMTGQPVGSPILHDSPVKTIKFSADGQRVVALAGYLNSDLASQVRVWEVPSGRPVGPPIHQSGGVDFSLVGDRIVIGAGHVARVWDVRSGEPVTPPMSHREQVSSVELSQDGRFVLTTTGRGNLASVGNAYARLWNAATGQPVSPLLRHSDLLRIVSGGQFSPDGSLLATSSGDGTARIWPVPSEDHSVADLRRLAEVLSATKLDAVGSLSPLTKDERLVAWKYLRIGHPDWFEATSRQVVVWRHSEAVHCLKTQRWSEAIVHLNELIEALPAENVGLRMRRWQAALGNLDWQLATRDAEAMIAGAGELRNHTLLNNLAWDVLVTGDNLQMANLKRTAVQLAEKACELAPMEGAFWNTLGVAHYRSDNLHEAIGALQKSMELRNSGDCYDWFFVAMSNWRLGHAEEARAWYDKAVASMADNATSDETLLHFRAEAEETLGLDRNDTEHGRAATERDKDDSAAARTEAETG